MNTQALRKTNRSSSKMTITIDRDADEESTILRPKIIVQNNNRYETSTPSKTQKNLDVDIE